MHRPPPLASVCAGDDLGNFRTGDDLGNFRVWSAALASVRLASPEARQTPTARGARAPWAAPYAPARPSEIGISSEEGGCRLAPTGTACSTARSADAARALPATMSAVYLASLRS